MINIKNVNKFMFYLLCYLIFLTFFFGYFLSYVFPKLISFENSAYYLMLTSCLCFLVPLFVYSFVKKIPIKELVPFKKISFKNLVLITLITFASQPLINLISVLTSLFFENEVSNTVISFSSLPFWQMFLAVAIFPAINEELIFRGLILTGFKNSSTLKAALITGLFFGIMHLDKHQFFYATIIGAFLAYLVKITGSIFSSIWVHFLINGSQVIKLYLAKFFLKNFYNVNDLSLNATLAETSITPFVIIQFLLLALGSLPILALFLWLFYKNNKQIKQNEILVQPELKKEKLLTRYFYLTIGVFLIYIVFGT